MSQQNARAALRLIDKVSVQADDMTLAAVMQCKAWLRAIVKGDLVVEPKPTPVPTAGEPE